MMNIQAYAKQKTSNFVKPTLLKDKAERSKAKPPIKALLERLADDDYCFERGYN